MPWTKMNFNINAHPRLGMGIDSKLVFRRLFVTVHSL